MCSNCRDCEFRVSRSRLDPAGESGVLADLDFPEQLLIGGDELTTQLECQGEEEAVGECTI